jgi:subfamily B ATP-binding cassette protein MsbA
VLDGSLGASLFIGYLVIFSQLINPAKHFSKAYYQIQRGIASAQRIEEILEVPVVIREKPDALRLQEFQDKIVYDHVRFAYGQEPVLEDINLQVAKGRMIALVGPSGAGKSTLADLLPRFYDVVEGAITIDGKDIRDVTIRDLRNLMGIVSQEPILFNDTIFNNIAFGKEGVQEADVVEAAKIANAHEFIERMPKGYRSYVGERGQRLSGGERQRITIARAVLKNPPILILDEATSSLDSESEKLVQEALFELMKNRTSIVIAHRLSTIQFADEIIVMREGRIIERGNHIGLMAKNGMYKRLVEMQAF